MRVIAGHYGTTGLCAAHIAIREHFLQLFGEEYGNELPDPEQIKKNTSGCKAFLTDDRLKDKYIQTLARLGEEKNPVEHELIAIFLRHASTYDVEDLYTAGTLTGIAMAWLACGAISTKTWEELNKVIAELMDGLTQAQINRVMSKKDQAGLGGIATE
ncbi:MAG: hypothetical protein K2P67_09035 [Gallionellaceae bacterium]|nr:hypothetical protein [Gallionellaceae bacterium]